MNSLVVILVIIIILIILFCYQNTHENFVGYPGYVDQVSYPPGYPPVTIDQNRDAVFNNWFQGNLYDDDWLDRAWTDRNQIVRDSFYWPGSYGIDWSMFNIPDNYTYYYDPYPVFTTPPAVDNIFMFEP